MKSSLHDKAKGTGKMIKGRAKETVGAATHDRDLQDEGVIDQAAGKVQKKAGEIKKVLGR